MIRPLTTLAALALVAGPALAAPSAERHDWPQYRGQHRDGRSAETGLVRSWPESGPVELWRRPIGPAFAGFAAAAGHLYTAESDAEGEYVLKLDPATGADVWRSRIAGAFESSFGNGPRATPTVDGARLYALSGQGRLVALSTADGAVQWSVDLVERFGVEPMRFGFSTAPLVLGDLLVADVGASDGRALVAFDKATGEVRWGAGEGGAAYGSPLVIEHGGAQQLVLVNREGVLAVSPEGEALWSHPWAAGEGIKPALPIFVPPDLVFVSASYDIGALALRLLDDGTVEEVWQSRVMRNHFNSSVRVDDRVYGFDNATFKCVDPRTGEQTWAKRGGLGKGSLIAADGLLIVLTETGTLKLVEADPETYTELASAKVLDGRCWTSPTLWDGKLFLRNREEAVALDLRAAAPDPPGASSAATVPKAKEGRR